MLRHYPNEWEMRQAAEGAPDVFQEHMEPLYRLVKEFQLLKEDKKNGKE
jgi:hypothetical protein